MVRAALRWEISRLRVSSERLPSAPYRHAAPLEMTVAAGTPIVISTTAEWRNLLSLMVRAALRREISRLRASWERFLSAPIPTHTPARDDGGGGHPYRHFDRSGAEWRNLTPLMTEKPAPPYRHFDRSEAEWRNLLPLIVRAALRWEISRLRASWERFRSISHTGTYPRSR